MSHLKLLIGATALDAWRWARQHLYLLLVLAPLVLGMTYVGVGRLVRDNAEWEPTSGVAVVLAVLVVCALVALSLSRASLEIYHPRQPESLFDTLPVSTDTHLHVALLRRLARTSIISAAALVARTIFESAAQALAVPAGSFAEAHAPSGAASSLVVAVASPVLFVALTSLLETLAALEWIHWGHARSRAHLATAVAVLLPGAFLDGCLLLAFVRAEKLPARGWMAATIIVAGFVYASVLFFMLRALHRSWRAADIEYAKRLQAGERWSIVGERAMRRLVSAPPVAAQLARDLQLTLRAFSSAVYTSASIAVLWLLLLVVVLTSDWLPVAGPPAGLFEATWLPSVMAVKFVSVLMTASLVSLLPVLVAHQAPHLWLERSVGTSGDELWRAKLWYARLVTLPAPLLAWTAAALTGAVPLYYLLPLVGECLWLWWLMAVLAGALAYEIPEQPGLALIVMTCAALAVGLSVSLLWPMGAALYIFGLSQISMRGQMRAHYHLVKEED